MTERKKKDRDGKSIGKQRKWKNTTCENVAGLSAVSAMTYSTWAKMAHILK